MLGRAALVVGRGRGAVLAGRGFRAVRGSVLGCAVLSAGAVALHTLTCPESRNDSATTNLPVPAPASPSRRVAVLGGSFNPVSNAHLAIAAEVLHSGMVDEVWVTPCGPRLDKPSMTTSAFHRSVMCHLAVDTMFAGCTAVKVCDAETHLERALGTWSLLQRLQRAHPQTLFYFVIGDDLVDDIESWDDPDLQPDPNAAGPLLVAHANFLVVPRPGFVHQRKLPPNFVPLSLPFPGCDRVTTQLSSSEIRRRIARATVAGHEDVYATIEGLVPPAVLCHIRRNNLFR